ncbi:MAG: WD40 repeat domain-containing protein, partial [Crocinitomicaceae bacterium]
DKTNCIPQVLKGVFKAEPIWIDFRDVAQAKNAGDYSLKNPDFKQKIAQISSAVQGVSVDHLIGESNRKEKAWKLALSLMVSLGLIAIFCVSFFSIKANEQEEIANKERKTAAKDKHYKEMMSLISEAQKNLHSGSNNEMVVANLITAWHGLRKEDHTIPSLFINTLYRAYEEISNAPYLSYYTESQVNCIAVSSDNGLILSGDEIGNVFLRNDKGDLIESYKCESKVECVGFTALGKGYFVDINGINLIEGDSTKTFKTDRKFNYGYGPAMVTFSKNEDYVFLATSILDENCIYDRKGNIIAHFPVEFYPKGTLRSARFNDDNQSVLLYYEHKVMRWNFLDTNSSVEKIFDFPERMKFVELSDNEVVGVTDKGKDSVNGKQRIGFTTFSTNGQLLHSFEMKTNAYLSDVAISNDGKRILLGMQNYSGAGIMELWSTHGNLLGSFSGHTLSVSAVSFSNRKNAVISAGYDQRVVAWRIVKKDFIETSESGWESLLNPPFSGNGRYVIGAIHTTDEILDASNLKVIDLECNSSDTVNLGSNFLQLQISDDSKYIVTVNNDSTIHLLDLSKKKIGASQFQFSLEENEIIQKVAIANDAERLALLTNMYTRIFDASGTLLEQFISGSFEEWQIEFMQFIKFKDRQHLFIGSKNGICQIIDCQGRSIENFTPFDGDYSNYPLSIDWNKETNHLAVSFSHGKACIYDLKHGEISRKFSLRKYGLSSMYDVFGVRISFFCEEDFLVTSGYHGVVIWGAEGNEIYRSNRTGLIPIVSADARYVFWLGEDRMVREPFLSPEEIIQKWETHFPNLRTQA